MLRVITLMLPLAFADLSFALVPPAAADAIFHRGNSGEPETLDPHRTSTVAEANILRDLFEGLVIHSARAEVVPGVAESWSVGVDGKVYTFWLRSDARWSNGDAVTARDFVFSMRRLLDPATGAKYATILYPILNAEKINKGQAPVDTLGVTAVDERTLEIALESPTAYFLQLLTHQAALPVHPPSVLKLGADFIKARNLISNGAFALKEVVPAAHLKLAKNPKFHAAPTVKLDSVVYYPTEDRAAALRRFLAGELHSNDDVPTEQVKFIRDKVGSGFRVAPYLGTYYFAFNTKKGPLADARVRQALAMVVDREFLAEEIWGGTMLPAYSFVPPGIDNYEGGPAYVAWKDLSPIDREEAAIRLMQAAGFGPGGKPLTLEIRYNTSENHKKTSVALVDMWKPLNVEVKLFNTDVKTHYAHLREKGDFDIARAGWIADYSDPQNFLFLLQSDNPGFNYANYENTEFDALIRAAAWETDLKKRADILKKAEEIFLRDLPLLPLLYYSSKNLVSDRLVGWQNNILDVHPSRFLSLQ